ncbi:MAG: gamma-glutamyltransferase [Candidatus Thorarchaeota archaeon]|nr:MAG: gamma-glutamyltransferase [Candidatus Thorarchaeota archaeon]
MVSGMWITGRSDVIAPKGMVASSQPLATQAGVSVLRNGGNAVDAAVATAAVLDVVEPFSTGCGGDAFVLLHLPGHDFPLGFNGSGRAGSLATLDELIARGWAEIPERHAASVTVPGAMHLWHTLVKQYGRLDFGDVMAPAIEYAKSGFPVSPKVAKVWKATAQNLRGNEAQRVFTKNGNAPEPGDTMRNPDLAHVFETVSQEGLDVFYRGAVAEAIVETVQSDGGFITTEDMRRHTTEETTPLATSYRGVQVLEHPPNGQGFAAQLMLNIMEEFDLPSFSSFDVERLHVMIEAKKLAYADLYAHNGDPEFYRVPIDRILSKAYSGERSSLIDPSTAMDVPPSGIARSSDTVYLATADEDGRAVSFINSLYMSFGCGLVVTGCGIKLQNRGCLFSLDPGHPNSYAPRKRPFHTIIPGALYKDDELMGVFGIMGGDHQAEAHAQFVSNTVDHKMSPQEAIDHPRFHHDQRTNMVWLEEGLPLSTRGALQKKGHQVAPEHTVKFGGGQAILRVHDIWVAGSDYRKDGQASGY